MTTKEWFSTHRRNSHRRHLNQVPVGYFWGLTCRIPCVGHGIFSSIIEQGILTKLYKKSRAPLNLRGNCPRGGPSHQHSLLHRDRLSFFTTTIRVFTGSYLAGLEASLW